MSVPQRQSPQFTTPPCSAPAASPIEMSGHALCRNSWTATKLRRARAPSVSRKPILFRVIEGTGCFLCVEGRSIVELPWRTRKATCSPGNSGPGKSEKACHHPHSAVERTGSALPCSPGNRPAVRSPARGWALLEGWRPRAWTATATSRESWAALPACWRACTSS